MVRARIVAARLQQEAPALRNQLNDSLRQTQTVFRGIEPDNILDPSVLPTLETIQSVLPSQLDSLTTLASVGDWEALRQRVEQPLDVLSSLSAELVDAASGDLQNKRSEAARQIERAQIRTLFILTAVGGLTIVIAALQDSVSLRPSLVLCDRWLTQPLLSQAVNLVTMYLCKAETNSLISPESSTRQISFSSSMRTASGVNSFVTSSTQCLR